MLHYLKADNIWVHHLFHACSGGFFTFRLVLFKNCFKEPDDIYSVMNMTYIISNSYCHYMFVIQKYLIAVLSEI